MKASTRKLIKSSRISKRKVRGSVRYCVVHHLSKPPAGAPRNKKTGKVLRNKKLFDGCFASKKDAEKRVRAR